MSDRDEAQRAIAAWLDRPSVYMSGPSERSMRKADDLLAALAIAGLKVVDVEQDGGG